MQNKKESYDEANVYKTSDNDWVGIEKLFYLVGLVGMKNKHHVRQV